MQWLSTANNNFSLFKFPKSESFSKFAFIRNTHNPTFESQGCNYTSEHYSYTTNRNFLKYPDSTKDNFGWGSWKLYFLTEIFMTKARTTGCIDTVLVRKWSCRAIWTYSSIQFKQHIKLVNKNVNNLSQLSQIQSVDKQDTPL